MSKKKLGIRRFPSCLVGMILLLAGLLLISPLVFAQVEKAPVTAPKAGPAKLTAPAAEKAAAPLKARLAPGEKVNINTATKENLAGLPGIGPAKAQAIIDGRPYAKPEDIMKVKGIKKGTYEKLKDLITVQ